MITDYSFVKCHFGGKLGKIYKGSLCIIIIIFFYTWMLIYSYLNKNFK